MFLLAAGDPPVWVRIVLPIIGFVVFCVLIWGLYRAGNSDH